MDSRQLQLVLQLQDNASRELRKIVNGLGDVEDQTKKTSSMFGGMARSIAGVAAAYVSFRSAYDSLALGVKVAADLQTAEVGLKTLLGSADEAAQTVERLKKEAARTPFELTGLTQATQLLTSVTKDGNKSIDVILDIGEALAAMGKGQTELDRIIVNLQQIAATGKAATIDIKQFAFAGIPIYEMLNEYLAENGKQMAEVTNAAGLTEKEIGKLGNTNQSLVTKISLANDQLAKQKNRLREMQKNDNEGTASYKNLQIDIENTKDKIAALNGELLKNKNTLDLAGQTVVKYGDSTMKVDEAIEQGIITFDVLTEMFDKANDEGGRFFNAYVNNAGTFNQAAANMKDSFAIMMADIVKGTGIFDGLTIAMLNVSEVMMNYKTVLGEAGTTFNEVMASFDEKTEIITHVKGALAEIVETYNIWLKPALEELGAKLIELKPLWEAMGTVFSGFLVVTIHILVVAIKGLTMALVAVLGLLTDIVNWILDKVIGTIDMLSTAFQFIAALINGDVKGAFQVLKDSMSGVFEWFEKLIGKAERFIELLGEMGGDAVDFVKDKLSKRATGGSVASGGAYMVGENGPELFRPNTNGNIIPNYGLAGAGMGGLTLNIYGDVTGEEIVDKVSSALMDRINNRIRT